MGVCGLLFGYAVASVNRGKLCQIIGPLRAAPRRGSDNWGLCNKLRAGRRSVSMAPDSMIDRAKAGPSPKP